MASVITSAGRAILSSRLSGGGTEPKNIGIGTGGGTSQVTDTTLFSEVNAAGLSSGTRLAGTSTQASSSASFNATIATTTMTVTTAPTGNAIAPGQTVTGAGVTASSVVLSQLTGVPGGTGTYTLSQSSTVASAVAMTATGVNDMYKVTGTVTSTDASTLTITNAGLFDNTTIGSGGLFEKGDFTGVPLNTGDQLALTITQQNG